MKSMSVKVLLVVICIFVLSCCGGGGKKNEGNVVPEVDSNTELKVEATDEIDEESEDVSTDEPEEVEEAELKIEEIETEDFGDIMEIDPDAELIILPKNEEYYTPPYDPNMVVEDESNNNMPVVVNQVEVMLNEGENKETADELAVKVNGTVVGVMPLNMYVIELQTSTINELEDAIEIIEADPRVKVATMSGFFEAYIMADTKDLLEKDKSIDMWAYKRIQIVEAWQSISDSGIKLNSDIKVGVIDSGIDTSHPEFNDITIKGRNELEEESESYHDRRGHGTYVSGIIAADNDGQGMNGLLTGLSNNFFELYVYKASNGILTLSSRAILNALLDISRDGVQVANMSFGFMYKDVEKFQKDKEIYEAFFAQSPNTLFVIAAGNNGKDSSLALPASVSSPNVISVAAINKDDERSKWILQSSNYGGKIHISAPGTHVYTTDATNIIESLAGLSKYTYKGGTSMAAPFVAGVASLLLQIDPTLTQTGVRSTLISTADSIEVTYPDNSKHTWRRLNALNAVNHVIEKVKNDNSEEDTVIEPQILPIVEDIEPEQESDPNPVITPPPPVNHPPVVSNVVLSGTGIHDGGTGNITITYSLADADGHNCDITVEYKNDMAVNPEWRSATTIEESFSVAPGDRSITWQSNADVPYFGSYKIRITPTDTETGTAGISDLFEIDNNPAPPPNTPPTAKIEKPANNSVFYREDEIEFNGILSDVGGGLVLCDWASDVDGGIGNESFIACYVSDSDQCNLSVGVHVITLTAYDAEGLTGTDSVAITISDKYEMFLIEEASQLYYCQNNKAYLTDTDTVKIMADAGLPGWTTYKNDSASNYMEGPKFVSDGVLLREVGTDPVYLVIRNKLRWIRSVKALNWMDGVLGEVNYDDDIIDAPSVIIAKYDRGNDIFAVGDDFVDCYGQNQGYNGESPHDWYIGWPGNYVSAALEFPITKVETALNSGYSGISGKYQTFGNESVQLGAIDASEKGAFAVYGAIYTMYKKLGYSGSKLGFPISDEYGWWFFGESCRRSDFEGGYIYWVPSTDETHIVWKGISEITGNIVEIGDVSPYHVGDEIKIGEINYIIKGLGQLKTGSTCLKLDKNVSADIGTEISIVQSVKEAESIELIGLTDAIDDTLYDKIIVDDASVLNTNGYKTIRSDIVQFAAINDNTITLVKSLEPSGLVRDISFSFMDAVYNYPCYFIWQKYDPDDASSDKLGLYFLDLPSLGIQTGDNLLIDEGTESQETAVVTDVTTENNVSYRVGIAQPLTYFHFAWTVVRDNNESDTASTKLVGAVVKVKDGKGLKKSMVIEISEPYLDIEGIEHEFKLSYTILWAEDNFIVLDRSFNLNYFSSAAKVNIL